MEQKMKLSDYKLIKLMDKGGFGSVYLCEDANKKQHCVKHIPARNNTDRQMIAREIYLLVNLKHPKIVQFRNFFSDDRCMYIVMEYMPKGNLRNLLEARREYFSQTEVLRYFKDLLLGLEYLHLRHVIHRDIKPANILIANDGSLKFADFGISKVHSGDDYTAVTQPGTHGGSTPFYMAPEALRCHNFTFASDIWALGCCMYEICLLNMPFQTNCQSLKDVYIEAMRNVLPTIPEHFSANLNTLLQTMLEPDPEKRATINWIVTQPIIMRWYYDYYLTY